MTHPLSYFAGKSRTPNSRSKSPLARRRNRLQLEGLESRRVLAAVTGLVTEDLNGDGIVDDGEPGQDLVRVYADLNGNGELDIVGDVVEPDEFANGEQVSVPGVSFSVVNRSNVAEFTNDPGPVVAIADGRLLTTTGNHVFGYDETPFFWTNFRLRADFDTPVSAAEIGFSAEAPDGNIGALDAYDSDDNLVASYQTATLVEGQHETMSVTRTEGDIAYVVAYTDTFAPGFGGTTGRLDSLRVNATGSEPWTWTNQNGDYWLDVREGGTYTLRQEVPSGYQQTLPADNGARSVGVSDTGTTPDADFANRPLPGWQNPVNPFDVVDDGSVFPIDVLRIINELNNPEYSDPETGLLPPAPDPVPFYFDVDGDGFASPTDVILIINFLNSQGDGPARAVAADDNRDDAADEVAPLVEAEVASAIHDADVATARRTPMRRATLAAASFSHASEGDEHRMKRDLTAAHVDEVFAN